MQIPKKGFYTHYKHDTKGTPNNYTYEVVGIARNTEEKTYTVLYRPLYENDWFKPADYQSRPLDMFNETISKDGQVVPRFQLITDPEKVSELEVVRAKMYGKSQKDWSEYYEITKAKPPSKLLVKALEHITSKGKAIDIGAGALKDTRYLLEQGFEVTAVDKSPLMEQEAKALGRDKLHAFTTSFEDFDFPENEYDIASSMFALPFTEPEHFEVVFNKIKSSLKKSGIFCGQFFGLNDEWSKNPKMTFHTETQVKELLKGFEIFSFKEVEEDGTTANGTPKHWHIFHVIARK